MSKQASFFTVPRVAIGVAVAVGLVVGGFALAGLGKAQLGLGKADAEQADADPTPALQLAAEEPAAVVDAVGAPADFAVGVAALNSERQMQGASTLVWSADLAANAGKQLDAVRKSRCTHQALSHAETTADGAATSFHRVHGLQQLDGSSRAQNLSAAAVFGDWIAGKQGFRASTERCDGSDACRSWRLLTAAPVKSIGCASVACEDGVQLWACRTGD